MDTINMQQQPNERALRECAALAKLQRLGKWFEAHAAIERKYPEYTGDAEHELRYEELESILEDAYMFAAYGKGEERHGAHGLRWEQQRHATIAKELGTGFAIGQAAKKSFESERLDPEAAERELLGAITYLASAVYAIRQGWR